MHSSAQLVVLILVTGSAALPGRMVVYHPKSPFHIMFHQTRLGVVHVVIPEKQLCAVAVSAAGTGRQRSPACLGQADTLQCRAGQGQPNITSAASLPSYPLIVLIVIVGRASRVETVVALCGRPAPLCCSPHRFQMTEYQGNRLVVYLNLYKRELLDSIEQLQIG